MFHIYTNKQTRLSRFLLKWFFLSKVNTKKQVLKKIKACSSYVINVKSGQEKSSVDV